MGVTINNRLRKAMTAFLFWERDGDGSMEELATALYDLAGDYQALLEDYRKLEEEIEALGDNLYDE